jgi:hypothetical protein
MALYKVVHGIHVQGDRDQPINGPDGKPTGRFAPRTYKAGETFESEADLVAMHGQKFAYVGAPPAGKKTKHGESTTLGDPVGVNAEASAVFPHGQVLQGHAATSGSSALPPYQHAISPEKAAEMREKHADRLPEPAKAKGEGGEQADDLEGKTNNELKSLAEAEEIDLAGAHNKDERVKAIRAARRAR